jgi:hypothetical protein
VIEAEETRRIQEMAPNNDDIPDQSAENQMTVGERCKGERVR